MPTWAHSAASGAAAPRACKASMSAATRAALLASARSCRAGVADDDRHPPLGDREVALDQRHGLVERGPQGGQRPGTGRRRHRSRDGKRGAERARDVTLLVNNAGSNTWQNLVTGNMNQLRLEVETHLFGALHMVRAFAPALGRNGGGAVLNVLVGDVLVRLRRRQLLPRRQGRRVVDDQRRPPRARCPGHTCHRCPPRPRRHRHERRLRRRQDPRSRSPARRWTESRRTPGRYSLTTGAAASRRPSPRPPTVLRSTLDDHVLIR